MRPAVQPLIDPFRLKPLPAIGDHRVGGGVRVGSGPELSGKQLRGMRRERLAKPLPVIDHRLRPLGVEDGKEFVPWRAFRARAPRIVLGMG